MKRHDNLYCFAATNNEQRRIKFPIRDNIEVMRLSR